MAVSRHELSGMALIPLGLALVIEAAWVFALSASLNAWLGGGIGQYHNLLVVVGFLLATAGGAFWVLARALSPRYGRVLVVVGIAFLTAAVATGWDQTHFALESASQRVWLGVAVPALLAIWRGSSIGRMEWTVEAIESRFQVAVSAFILLLLGNIPASSVSGAPTPVLTGSGLVMLFAGLVAIPLARALRVGAKRAESGTSGVQVNVQWLAMLVALVTGLLLVALLLSQALGFSLLEEVLRPFGAAIAWVYLYTARVVFWIAEKVFRLLANLGGGGNDTGDSPSPPVQSDPLPNSGQAPQPQPGEAQPPLSPEIADIFGLLFSAVIFVGGPILILWMFHRKTWWTSNQQEDGGIEELHDFVWSWSQLSSGLRTRLEGLWEGRKPVVKENLRGAASRQEGSVGTAREMYRELLGIGAELGRPRASDETPYQYEQVLTDMEPLASSHPQLHALTEVYVQAQYGPDPPSDAQLSTARRALQTLKELRG